MRFAELDLHGGDDVRHGCGQPQPFAAPKQVPVLPRCFRTQPFVRPVADADADRAVPALRDFDSDGDAPVLVERIGRADLNNAEQRRRDDPGLGAGEQVAVERIARSPGELVAHHAFFDAFEARNLGVAERGDGAWLDDERDTDRALSVIDNDPPVGHSRERMPAPAEPLDQLSLGGQYRSGPGAFAQCQADDRRISRADACAIGLLDGNRGKQVRRAGLDSEHEAYRVRIGINVELDGRRVVAVRPHDLEQAVAVTFSAQPEGGRCDGRALSELHGVRGRSERRQQLLIRGALEDDTVVVRRSTRCGRTRDKQKTERPWGQATPCCPEGPGEPRGKIQEAVQDQGHREDPWERYSRQQEAAHTGVLHAARPALSLPRPKPPKHRASPPREVPLHHPPRILGHAVYHASGAWLAAAWALLLVHVQPFSYCRCLRPASRQLDLHLDSDDSGRPQRMTHSSHTARRAGARSQESD